MCPECGGDMEYVEYAQITASYVHPIGYYSCLECGHVIYEYPNVSVPSVFRTVPDIPDIVMDISLSDDIDKLRKWLIENNTPRDILYLFEKIVNYVT